jgi:hypothetical protein
MNILIEKLNKLSSQIWDKVFEGDNMGYFKNDQIENPAGEQGFYEEIRKENEQAVKLTRFHKDQMDWLFDHIVKGGKK